MLKLMLFTLWLCGVGFGLIISLLVDVLTKGDNDENS